MICDFFKREYEGLLWERSGVWPIPRKLLICGKKKCNDYEILHLNMDCVVWQKEYTSAINISSL